MSYHQRNVHSGAWQFTLVSKLASPIVAPKIFTSNRNSLMMVTQAGLVMDKRLAKRHKRKVARAKEHVKLSEPDLRTPEQIKAARDASRAPEAGRGGPALQNSALS